MTDHEALAEIAAIFKAAGDEEINGADLVDEVGRILREHGILDGVERSVPCFACGGYGYHEVDCELLDRDPEEE